MSKDQNVQKAIALLEKITGKKVILEYIPPVQDVDTDTVQADPSEISLDQSARQKGAARAMETKGYQNWTPEQYAVCYFLKKYGKMRMPMPFKSMSLDQLADEMNAKKSTLGMNGENIKYLLTGKSSLESASPKAAALVQKFETMDIDQVWRHARRAFEQGRLAKQVQNDPRLQGKVSTMGKTAKDFSPEILAKINARRAERGEAPLGEAVVRKAWNNLQEKLMKESAQEFGEYVTEDYYPETENISPELEKTAQQIAAAVINKVNTFAGANEPEDGTSTIALVLKRIINILEKEV